MISVTVMGGFAVTIDGRPVAPDAWPKRSASDLVKLLTLSEGHRLAREQVLEALWPHLDAEQAATNLHKAASYARRALGDKAAIVLSGGQVQLAPEAELEVDLDRVLAGDGGATAASHELLDTATRSGPAMRATGSRRRSERACATKGTGRTAATAASRLGDAWPGVRRELIELCERETLDPGRCAIDSGYLLATGEAAV